MSDDSAISTIPDLVDLAPVTTPTPEGGEFTFNILPLEVRCMVACRIEDVDTFNSFAHVERATAQATQNSQTVARVKTTLVRSKSEVDPKTGILTTYSVGLNGLMEGARRTFSKKGRLMSSVEYHRGLQHGLSITYVEGDVEEDEDPIVLLVEHWRCGLKHGKEKSYHANGTKKMGRMWCDGIQHGQETFYLEDGQVQRWSNFSNGCMVEGMAYL